MEAGKKVIVSEYPFSEKQKGRLRDLADTYAYEVITIRWLISTCCGNGVTSEIGSRNGI